MPPFIHPLPRLRDGREPITTSGAYTESRPYHNGSDIVYLRRPGEPSVYPYSDGKWIVPGNVPVLAIADGKVTFVGTHPEWRGWRVTLDHGIYAGDALGSQYRHLQSRVKVHEGQYVKQGQILGYVGPLRKDALNHLHFMLRMNGDWVDPDEFVDALPIVDFPRQRPGWLIPAALTVFLSAAGGGYYYFTHSQTD